jgi:hypothetical protein
MCIHGTEINPNYDYVFMFIKTHLGAHFGFEYLSPLDWIAR